MLFFSSQVWEWRQHLRVEEESKVAGAETERVVAEI